MYVFKIFSLTVVLTLSKVLMTLILFNSHLLSTWRVLGTLLGAGGTERERQIQAVRRASELGNFCVMRSALACSCELSVSEPGGRVAPSSGSWRWLPD